MTKYKKIAKTRHYEAFHEKEFNFEEVIRVLDSTKSHRKKGDKIIVETDAAYILCVLRDDVLYIINAKRK